MAELFLVGRATGDLTSRSRANGEEARRRAQLAAADPERQTAMAEARQRAMVARMVASGFPERHVRRCTWAGIAEPERSQLRGWAADPARLGLVISGSVGTGKTGAVTVACRTVMEEEGTDARFVHCEALLALLASSERAARDTLTALAGCGLLVIDDLGAGGRRPAWVVGRFELLINQRQGALLPTVVTTNLRGPEALAATYGAPLRSRLCDREMAHVVRWSQREDRRVGGVDWREE